MKRIILGALAALCANPVMAKDDVVFVTFSPVADKPVVTIDPTKAYILLRSDSAAALTLIKDPTPEDQVAYDKLRADALTKAKAKYVGKLKSYESWVVEAKKTGKRPPEKPVEPTESNFEFTPFGMMAQFSIGPMFRFSKQGGGSTYLHAVTPGSYRIYGPVFTGANGMMGTCLCMGSVRFEARAGEIVDLGKTDNWVDRPTEASMPPELGFRLVPPSKTMELDPRLQGAKVYPAAYRPAGKLPNYYGLTISRLPEMRGVMRYERDRIIDLTVAGTGGSAGK